MTQNGSGIAASTSPMACARRGGTVMAVDVDWGVAQGSGCRATRPGVWVIVHLSDLGRDGAKMRRVGRCKYVTLDQERFKKSNIRASSRELSE